MATRNKKIKVTSGQCATKPDTDDPDKNPLLYVENKHNFRIDTDNLLENPDSLIYHGYENFDLKKEKDHFDVNMLNEDSDIVIMLRYYEYLCVAEFKFCYILPLLHSGMIAKEVFEMVQHCLKNKLLMNVPSFDKIFEPDIQYIGKIKYK